MKISWKFGEPSWCSFPLRALTPKIIKEVYGLTVLHRHIFAVKGIILSHFSRPKVTLKTIGKVNKLDAGTPSCTQPLKPFSIVSMQYSQH